MTGRWVEEGNGEAWERCDKRIFQIAATGPTFTDKQFERGMVHAMRSKSPKMARKEAPFVPFWWGRKIAKERVSDVIDVRDNPPF